MQRLGVLANDCRRNEFGIPDVPNEPCLLLCPHITMLALIFADQAFAVPEALADSTLRPQMINLGSVTGMELPTGPYTFRRGNGEALDNSSE